MSTDSSPQQHEMQLLDTHPSGATEWYCPICGRRFLLQFPPDYKKIVLETGDEYAQHSGGMGGLRMSISNVTQEDELIDEERLAPWNEWMDDVDFDKWWGQESP